VLIHLGDGEFVKTDRCLGIFDLACIDDVTAKAVREKLKHRFGPDLRSVVLLKDGTWMGSNLTSTTLADRGDGNPFANAAWVRRPVTG